MLRIKEYETIYIMRPDISDVDADRITDRMRGVIRAHDGKIVEIDNWGKRRLAYEIAKHQKGIYVYWRYIGNNETVQELERNLRLLEPVLRFLTVKLEDSVDPESVADLPDEQIPMRTAAARAEYQESEESAEVSEDEASDEDEESNEDEESDDDEESDKDD